MSLNTFRERFRALTDFTPMQWQSRMFERFVADDLPNYCDIPTGLGKTSVIDIWLLALVSQAENDRVRLPRRLVYIVNRRTVVDQATATVVRLRRRLENPDNEAWHQHAGSLRAIVSTLTTLCVAEDSALALSTLRGELADNQEWKTDPTRAAIIVGTIDMIGSKLLFSGYGDGHYGRAHHAGLIGHDALIIHDEAHLTPAFGDLLRAIAQEQARNQVSNGKISVKRPIRVMELSATARESASDARTFTLESHDKQDRIVHERLTAAKRLYLHQTEDDTVVGKIVELSIAYQNDRVRVLVYVRSPERAKEIASGIRKALSNDGDERIALLTGTIRGYERDQLVKSNPVYQAMLEPSRPIQDTVYLVSTSAGEVGIDLDADHLVCDLTSLDALIQRLGRVNRRAGNGRHARVDVVGDVPSNDKQTEFDSAVSSTLKLLEQWMDTSEDGLDVSPGNLVRLVANEDDETIEGAFSPRAEAAPLTDILLDMWSLTSIPKMAGRPEVAEFLHGVTTDLPYTYVAWRQEIRNLQTLEPLDPSSTLEVAEFEDTLTRWFRACRIMAHERVRDRTDRVQADLQRLLKAHQKHDDVHDFNVVVLDERGQASWRRLSEISEKQFNLNFRTVVLPVEVGGLDENGMLNPKLWDSPEGVSLDVCEADMPDLMRQRWLHHRAAEGVLRGGEHEPLRPRGADAPSEAVREQIRIALSSDDELQDEIQTDLVLWVRAREIGSHRCQTLADHTKAIEAHMAAIGERLNLPGPIREGLLLAARWHDKGKDRPIWQRYARNEQTEPLAKSDRVGNPRILGGYRHELGSVLDAMADPNFVHHSESDLSLHLIAAHHGHARPNFLQRSLDNTQSTSSNHKTLREAMRRFGRLQVRFGRWTLAWLESLLRCADAAVSQEIEEIET